MRTFAVSLVLMLTGLPAFAAEKGPAEGFTALFDGKSLDGWKTVNTKDNFFVRDGVLVMNKGAGWLASDGTYGDFELRVRYRFVTPGADSGIFVRASLEGKNWTNKGYQVQNMDNQTLGKFVGMGFKVKGEPLPDVVAKAKKPTGEWMDLVIRVEGTRGETTLNGQTVARSDDLQLKDGHLGLQAEGGVLEFERIDIKPIKN
ncbi:MAG: DUF1080 domain-containing protein [Isosphaeraceae bacterium]